jgi:hypothetical protein
MKWTRTRWLAALLLVLVPELAHAGAPLPPCTAEQQRTWTPGAVETIAEGITRQIFTDPRNPSAQCAVITPRPQPPIKRGRDTR